MLIEEDTRENLFLEENSLEDRFVRTSFLLYVFCSSLTSMLLRLTSYMFLVFTRVAFYISLTCFQVCDVFDFKSDELAGTMGTGSCDWTRKGPRD